MSRIEQLISDIESYIDNCKFQPLSNTKIIVNKEQLEDMLAELRLKTPEEVKKYQKILNNKDAIIALMQKSRQNLLLMLHRYRQRNLLMNTRLCSVHMHRLMPL